MTERRADYKVKVFVANGAQVQFTVREMRQLFASWQFWALVLVSFLIMATGHPIVLPQFEGFGVRLGFWLVALSIYMGLAEPYLLAVTRAWKRFVGRPIPMLLMTAPLILFATYAAGIALAALFEPGRPVSEVITWQMALRNLFVAHVFETASVCWLIPSLRARRAKSEVRLVTLAGKSIDLRRIGRVKSAEHYLEVHTEDGVELLRERMATFLEQVRPEDGIQPHRSHWVAAERVAGLSGTKLQLDCGNTVPIARGRMDNVRAWVAEKLSKSTVPPVPAG